jgi:hypothetical protein
MCKTSVKKSFEIYNRKCVINIDFKGTDYGIWTETTRTGPKCMQCDENSDPLTASNVFVSCNTNQFGDSVSYLPSCICTMSRRFVEFTICWHKLYKLTFQRLYTVSLKPSVYITESFKSCSYLCVLFSDFYSHLLYPQATCLYRKNQVASPLNSLWNRLMTKSAYVQNINEETSETVNHCHVTLFNSTSSEANSRWGKFFAFYGTQSSSTVFTKARHLNTWQLPE